MDFFVHCEKFRIVVELLHLPADLEVVAGAFGNAPLGTVECPLFVPFRRGQGTLHRGGGGKNGEAPRARTWTIGTLISALMLRAAWPTAKAVFHVSLKMLEVDAYTIDLTILLTALSSYPIRGVF